MKMMMNSPVGVKDFFEEDPLEKTKEWKNTFSFMECPVRVRKTSFSVSNRSEGGYSTGYSTCCSSTISSSSSDGYDSEASFGEEARSSVCGIGSTRDAILSEMEQVQRRLDWFRDQVEKDKEDYRQQLRFAKNRLREELTQRYKESWRRSSLDYRANKGRVVETNKAIAILQKDNARLRDEIQYLEQEIRKELVVHQDLKRAHKSAQKSCRALKNHVRGLEASREKLQHACTALRKKISGMKDDDFQRTAYLEMEARTVSKYETALGNILDGVEEREPRLLESMVPIAEASATEVIRARAEVLEAVGLDLTDSQKQRTIKVLDSDRLLLAAAKLETLRHRREGREQARRRRSSNWECCGYTSDDDTTESSSCDDEDCLIEDESSDCSDYEVASSEDEL